MKQPKPTIAKDAPEGTLWFGGPVEWFSISLRVLGSDLVPEEITRLLGCSPDRSQQKGEPIYRGDGTIARTARGGSWSLVLRPEDTDEWDCGEAMLELLQRVPAAASVWKVLSDRYEIGFFVGLSMKARNKGFTLSLAVMHSCSERGIEAGFDIYYEPTDAL